MLSCHIPTNKRAHTHLLDAPADNRVRRGERPRRRPQVPVQAVVDRSPRRRRGWGRHDCPRRGRRALALVGDSPDLGMALLGAQPPPRYAEVAPAGGGDHRARGAKRAGTNNYHNQETVGGGLILAKIYIQNSSCGLATGVFFLSFFP